MNNIPLTSDEIRTVTMFIDRFQAAQVQAQMAQELQVGYMQLLRAKYGLDEEWICRDVLDGFQRVSPGAIPPLREGG